MGTNKKLKHEVKRVLYFLRLIDADHKLSLTNIAVIIVLVKFMLTKDAIAPVDVGALIATLFSYQGSKLISVVPKKSDGEGAGQNK